MRGPIACALSFEESAYVRRRAYLVAASGPRVSVRTRTFDLPSRIKDGLSLPTRRRNLEPSQHPPHDTRAATPWTQVGSRRARPLGIPLEPTIGRAGHSRKNLCHELSSRTRDLNVSGQRRHTHQQYKYDGITITQLCGRRGTEEADCTGHMKNECFH